MIVFLICLWLSPFISADLNTSVLIGDTNRIFIETGCYVGNGVRKALQIGYQNIFSIEISPVYHRICENRFKRNPQVRVINGDSSVELQSLMNNFNEPITFWLDGHFSNGDTGRGDKNSPLMEELVIIKRHPVKTHTIMIDDIRLTGDGSNQFDDVSLYTIIKTIMSINPRYILTFIDGYAESDILVARAPEAADDSIHEMEINVDGSSSRQQRHVTAILHGDMGEQMFIIAATISYAWRNNLTFNFEPSHLRDEVYTNLLMDRRNTLSNSNISSSSNPMEVTEGIEFATLPAHPQRDVRLMGRFQNYLYFDADYLQISDYFQWALPGRVRENYFLGHLKEILSYKQYKKVFVECYFHPRAGDDSTVPLQPVLPRDYYQRAAEHINSVHADDVLYIVFSNDDVQAQEHLRGLEAMQLQLHAAGMHDALRFMLMSSFDGGAVLSEDSALGWWGAYVMDHARTLPIVVPRGSYAAAGEQGSTDKRMLPHWIEM